MSVRKEQHKMRIDKESAVKDTFRPEWARIQEAAQRIGIRSSRFYELLEESNGAIKTCVLKSPGAERGARLIYLPSLFTYMDKMAAEQEQAVSK
jgi:hypothetical protein